MDPQKAELFVEGSLQKPSYNTENGGLSSLNKFSTDPFHVTEINIHFVFGKMFCFLDGADSQGCFKFLGPRSGSGHFLRFFGFQGLVGVSIQAFGKGGDRREKGSALGLGALCPEDPDAGS